jgi:hypothetical protein
MWPKPPWIPTEKFSVLSMPWSLTACNNNKGPGLYREMEARDGGK